MKPILFTVIFLFLNFLNFYSQEQKKGIKNVKRIGFLYNNANEKNFWFDDLDYYYTTNTFKFQLFYNLGSWKTIDFELIIQPQIQHIKHQLLNEQYILPSTPNYLEKRKEFTSLKSITLLGLEFGFSAKKELFKEFFIVLTAGIGIANLDKRTERVAKGFTFIENGSLGFSFKTFSNTYFYLGGNIGHVSNFNLKFPNAGYNLLGLEVGISFELNK